MPTRVVIVDDSATARLALRLALEGDPGIEIAGEAAGGAVALQVIEAVRPDIVTMDVCLRGESGIDVTRVIMERCAVPIVVITSADISDSSLVYSALDAGALEVHAKPPAPTEPGYEHARQRLTRVIRALATVPVVHRKRPVTAGKQTTERAALIGAGAAGKPFRPAIPPQSGESLVRVVPAALPQVAPARQLELIVIGASTGGPPLLARILQRCRPPLSLPFAIVQHIDPSFAESLARWLAQTTSHDVQIARRAMRPEPGQVLVAPPERHLVMTPGGMLAPSAAPPRRYCRPSVDVLFESVAEHAGPSVAAVLLSGMGEDGARGLAALKQAGALTIVQSPATCVVAGMPESAMRRASPDLVLDPEDIADALVALLAQTRLEQTVREDTNC